MKKVIFVFITLLAMASCLSDGEYTRSYTTIANFEYSNFNYETNFGEDSLYFDTKYGGYGIGWDLLAFCHKVDTVTKTFEGGMLLSYLKGETFNPADSTALAQSDSLVYARDRFRVNDSLGAYSPKTYMVYYGNPDPSKMPEHDVEFTSLDQGPCQVHECYVNNTEYVAYKVSKNFVDGDRLTLKAKGWKDGKVTGEASIVLADFSAQKDSIMTTWTRFDLSKLGGIDYMDFEVESTNKEIPAYFCMDNFKANITISY